jgi:hypothetical protein
MHERKSSGFGYANMKPTVESTSIEIATQRRAGMASGTSAQAEQVKYDPMRRFAPTPYVACLPVMGSAVRLETNSSKVLRHMVELFAGYPGASSECPKFLWRIVVDSDVPFCQPWPRRSTFSDDGLRFAQFGQKNFMAVNIEAREAIAFVAEGLVDDALGFTSPFIDTLFYMTVGSLGLVPLAAACVSSGAKGLLVLGAPNQGKTTASYLAAQEGLTYHADQSVFLEMTSGGLRAWADFVPIAFRPETLQFLPELESRTRLFSYCDFNFHYLLKDKPGSKQLGFVTPVCCVVLEREASSAQRLVRFETTGSASSLPEYIAFKDDDRFEKQRFAVLAALAQLPAYHLAYGSDPASAAPFLRQLLASHAPGSSQHDGS